MRSLVLIVALILCACARTTLPAPERDPMAIGAVVIKTYTGTTARLANPERGFYHYSGDCDKDTFIVSDLVRYRTQEGISLVMCMFYLSEFRSSPISQAQLDHFSQQAAAVRRAGLKMVLRFAYTDDQKEPDAPLSRVKAHLAQLAPYLKVNSDVIAVVQSGFVGAYGEGYYTRYFGDEGVISQANWADRKTVVDELLTILPKNISVQVRTPKMKRRMYGTAPVTSSSAFGGSAVARVGHHNDCFLASTTDQGTYLDIKNEYPYLASDTRYTPMGGETCEPNPPRSDCPTALRELAMFHYTYLNRDYEPAVLDGWMANGCLDQIERQLGYRFALISSEFPTAVKRGATFTGKLVVHNDGWTGLIKPRPVKLVLRETSTHKVVRLTVLADPRRWAPRTNAAISQAFKIPSSMTTGTYELLLSFPDSTTSLMNKPAYAVRLANTSIWEAATGYNRLLRTIEVY